MVNGQTTDQEALSVFLPDGNIGGTIFPLAGFQRNVAVYIAKDFFLPA
jgi:hypothetical protein